MVRNKKTRLYLMRHGQTLFNVHNRIQGWCDSPLTDLGRKQALQVRAYFEKHGLTFDHYYCTTTERASDTLELATGQTQYTRVKGLKEMHFGAFEGQPEYLHPKPNSEGHYGDHYLQFGGESQSQFEERVVTAATQIVEQHPGQSILAVSHAGALMSFWHAIAPEQGFPKHPNNCAILVFDYDDQGFHFVKMIDPLADKEYSDF